MSAKSILSAAAPPLQNNKYTLGNDFNSDFLVTNWKDFLADIGAMFCQNIIVSRYY